MPGMTSDDFVATVEAAVNGALDTHDLAAHLGIPRDALGEWAGVTAELAVESAQDVLSDVKDTSAVISATIVALTSTAFMIGALFERKRAEQ